MTATCRHAQKVVCRTCFKSDHKYKHHPREYDFGLHERATDCHSNVFEQRAITVIIAGIRPRARQRRSVINFDNIARVPTVNERQRWDLPCILNLNARSLNTEKIDELQVIASNYNVSIICVTETWLKTILTMSMFLLTGIIANGETGPIGEREVLHVM